VGSFAVYIHTKSAISFSRGVTSFKYLCLYRLNLSAVVIFLILLVCGDIHPNPGPVTSRDLKIIHLNVCSLKDKIGILEAEFGSYDVICITETWLHSGINNTEISIPNFHFPFRKDRESRGGGVAVYVKSSLNVKLLNNLTIAGLEAVWVQIRCKSRTYIIGTIYRADKSEAYWELIDQSIGNAVDLNMYTIVAGDFNLDILNTNKTKIDNIELLHGLKQIVTDATRITPNSKTLIDLLFVTNNTDVRNSGVLDPICSDHCPIFVIIKESISNKIDYKRKIYNYSQINTTGLLADISNFDWASCYSSDSLDDITDRFTSALLRMCDKNIPNKYVTIRPKDKPWMNGEIRTLMRKRNRQHKLAKKHNNPYEWAKFRSMRNKVVSAVRNAKRQHDFKLDKMLGDAHGTKTWWRLVKTYLKGNCKAKHFPPIVHNGMLYDDAEEIATVFNDYFSDQSRVSRPNDEPPCLNTDVEHPFCDIVLNVQEVQDILLSVDVTKASGPDGISNKILKLTAKSLAIALTELFNMSLKKCHFPAIWKEASVIPIHKKGNLGECSNYRPVALTSCLAKVFEKCIFKHVFNYFLDNNILSNLQSGFMPGDSTSNQLTYLYDSISRALDDGKEIRAVFCDISKAFDKVWHNGIINKLKSYGIQGHLLNWFESYLENRTQRVVIDGYSSEAKQVTAGVPQGSVLGPLLFLVYINDIIEDIDSNIRLFADDTFLYVIVENPNDTADILNNDLQKISGWAEKWQVTFNPNKTESIQFSRKLNPSPKPNLKMNDSPIKEVKSHKHLGITLQDDCRWNIHVNEIAQKISPMINCLRSLKYRLNRKTLEIMYKSFILPIFDYCSHIWDNCSDEQAQILEKLHLDALRTICGGVRGTSHRRIYDETGMQPLKDRRYKQKLTIFYKMKNNLLPEYLCDLIPNCVSTASNYNLRNSSKLQTIKCNTANYARSFLPDSIKLWNDLPSDKTEADSIRDFTNAIRGNNTTGIFFDLHFGIRFYQIVHSRLRLGCSELNAHKFARHISATPVCSCGFHYEDVLHYFFICVNYTDIRKDMYFYTKGYNLNTVLCGNADISETINSQILKSIHQFISLSGRFSDYDK